jgi:hypothetical protein
MNYLLPGEAAAQPARVGVFLPVAYAGQMELAFPTVDLVP